MTKKAAALLLAASLAVSMCATPVFAIDPVHGDEFNKDSTDQAITNVQYNVTEGYTWSIPATIDFGENAGFNKTRTVVANQKKNGTYSVAEANTPGSSGNVYVTGCRIKPGKTLTISTYSTNTTYDDEGFIVQTTNDGVTAKLHYDIYKGEVTDPETATAQKLDGTKNNDILTLDAGKDSCEQDLTFILKTGVEGEIAGKYTAQIRFIASVN